MSSAVRGWPLWSASTTVDEAFPRRHARTRRFTLGLARTFALAPDGARVTFLRSSSAEDAVHALWALDMDSGRERLVADPRTLTDAGEQHLTDAERARRERLRESGEGIVAYAVDRDVTKAVFVLGGQVWVADLVSGGATALPETQGGFDPRLDPTGQRVAFMRGSGVEVMELDAQSPQVLVAATPHEEGVSWGRAEFIAAEEMGRLRGFWWSPDGTRLAVTRVDESAVQRWHIGDPANPERAAQQLLYPAAGTANAEVSLWLADLDGVLTPVTWDQDTFEYLADVRWTAHGPLLLVVQSRDQRTVRYLSANANGETTVIREFTDPAWVDLIGGSPQWLPDGRLLHTVDLNDTRCLAIDGEPVTDPGLQVRHVVGVHRDSVMVQASIDPTAAQLWRIPLDGTPAQLVGGVGADTGMTDAVCSDALLVTVRRSLDATGPTITVHGDGREWTVAGKALPHGLTLNVQLLTLGERALRAALVLPVGYQLSDGPLPVLLDPYGGPHAQRVTQSADAYLTAQWFADQGYAVLIVDGRGTPGRGPDWERAVLGDLASPVLDDQVDALHAAAAVVGGFDLGRVAIRGWSFGGYLAALAVLRRPEVFHAAIAGAPVTDWALYDTHYTERYLGTPDKDPEHYRHSSLLDDAAKPLAPSDAHLARPLLLIHGLADDNVVAAHTLRLSAALLAAGRRHEVLPLSGVTHMTPQEVVAENLLRLQLDFLRRALPHP